MAQIVLQATTTGSTITTELSNFGPNESGVFNTLNIKTTQSPVTAWITGYTFTSAKPYATEPAVFLFNTSVFDVLPIMVTNNTITHPLSTLRTTLSATLANALSAKVYAAASGVQQALLVLILSGFCLSGAASLPLSAQKTAVDTTSQTLTFTLTAVNLPYNGWVCEAENTRMRVLGYI